MPDFPIPEGFDADACKYCAAIFIVQNSISTKPALIHPNGTVIFIECEGFYYLMTCMHVVEELLSLEKTSEHRYVFATYHAKPLIIVNRFHRVPSGLGGRQIDIAIRQINPGYAKQIDKKFITLSKKDELPINLSHAVSVGFPKENMRKDEINGSMDYRIAMPCVHALAEKNTSFVEDRFRLFSTLDSEPSTIKLGGMSGGPTYWTTDNQYGLLGLTCEASPTKPDKDSASLYGNNYVVSVTGEIVTYERFKSWIDILNLKDERYNGPSMEIKFNINIDEA
jgi:hypothetical protein